MGYFIANTKNKSFIKMSDKLKTKGEEKYEFMLRVYDEDLIDFDLDNYLEAINSDNETISSEAYDRFNKKIHEECRKNVWFFFREIFRVPFFNGTMIPFTLTDLSLQVIQLYSHNLGCISYNSRRQNGKTILLVGLYIYNKFIHLSDKGSVTTHYAVRDLHQDNETNTIYKNIKEFLTKNHLPGGIDDPSQLSTDSGDLESYFITPDDPWEAPSAGVHYIFIDNVFTFTNINDLCRIFSMLSENDRIAVYSINLMNNTLSSDEKRYYGIFLDVLTMISEKFNTVSSYENSDYVDSLYVKGIRTIVLKLKEKLY